MAEPTVSLRDFYVYALFRETGQVFYIGKGRRNRINQHHARYSLHGRSHKNNIVRKVFLVLGDLPRVKIAENLTEAEANELEIKLIAVIGRRPSGRLINGTDGGDGASGAIRSDDTRRRLSAALAGRAKTEAHKAAAAAGARLRVERMSPAERTAYVSRLNTSEAIARRRAALKGRKQGKRSAEWVANMKLGLRRFHEARRAQLGPPVCRRCKGPDPGKNGHCRACAAAHSRELRAKKGPKPRQPRSLASKQKQSVAMIAVWNRKGRSIICPRCRLREKQGYGYCRECHAYYERERRRKVSPRIPLI